MVTARKAKRSLYGVVGCALGLMVSGTAYAAAQITTETEAQGFPTPSVDDAGLSWFQVLPPVESWLILVLGAAMVFILQRKVPDRWDSFT